MGFRATTTATTPTSTISNACVVVTVRCVFGYLRFTLECVYATTGEAPPHSYRFSFSSCSCCMCVCAIIQAIREHCIVVYYISITYTHTHSQLFSSLVRSVVDVIVGVHVRWLSHGNARAHFPFYHSSQALLLICTFIHYQ